MAVRDIVTIPDPVLRKTSTPFEHVDESVGALIDDMLETMYASNGIGLAAIQTGLPRRLIVADVAEDGAGPAPVALINPEIVWSSDETSLYSEGCLSIPEHYAEVERPARCHIEFVNRKGEKDRIEAEGLLATCLQHEIDHLDGVLFVDYLSKLKRNMIIRKVAKASRGAPAL